MRLILHIGVDKSGATSLQHWLASDRAALLERGVLYPGSLGRVNHRLLSVYAIGYPSAEWQKVASRVAWAKGYEDFTGGLVRRLDDELARNGSAHCCVISSEHLHAALTGPAMVQRVHDLVSTRFEAVEVWIHLRPQVEVAVSLMSTRARLGQVVDAELLESIGPDRPYYNWYDLVSRWAGVFGKERIRVIAYRRTPDMTAYMAAHLGVPLGDTVLPRVRNRALGWGSVAMLNVLSGEGMDGDLVEAFRSCLERLPAGEKLSLSRTDAQRIQARFDEGNRRLVEEWPNALRWSDLQPDWSAYDEEGTFDKLARAMEFAAPLRGLMQCCEAALDAERAEKALLAARLARERGEHPAAREAAASAMVLRDRIAANPMHDPIRLEAVDTQLTDGRSGAEGGHAGFDLQTALRSSEGSRSAARDRGPDRRLAAQALAADPELNASAGETDYTAALTAIHERLRPRFYLEIGVRRGLSLSLAGCPAVGVDPAPMLQGPPAANHRVVEMSSDAFFAERASDVLAARVPDLVFIDGMHLFEYALRDFINSERWSSETTLIVIDDVFPNHPAQAKRERATRVWTGDVWKLYRVLKERRPDLFLLPLNTAPTGLLLVAGLDARSRVLADCYDELAAAYTDDEIDPDPECLYRAAALSPFDPVFSDLLDVLRHAREAPSAERAGILGEGLHGLSRRLADMDSRVTV